MHHRCRFRIMSCEFGKHRWEDSRGLEFKVSVSQNYKKWMSTLMCENKNHINNKNKIEEWTQIEIWCIKLTVTADLFRIDEYLKKSFSKMDSILNCNQASLSFHFVSTRWSRFKKHYSINSNPADNSEFHNRIDPIVCLL